MPRVIQSKFRRVIIPARAFPPSQWVILLAALLPIGGHYVKHLIGPLKPFFMADKGFHLTNTQFGAMLSSSDWALAIGPVISGLVVDIIGAHLAAILFTGLSLFGHVLFTIGVSEHHMANCLIGRCLYGIGETAVSISQGGIICHSFGREHLTISLGISESVRAFANWLGKVLPVQLAILFHTYLASLWFGTVLLIMSMGFALALFIMEHSHRKDEAERSSSMAELLSRGLKPKGIMSFPLQFWLLTGVHVLLNNVHNIFGGISTDYIKGRTGLSVEASAFLSSLDSIGPIFFCSLVSLVVSQTGKRLHWCVFASSCSVAGFLLLLYCPSVPIVVSMLLLSANTIIAPTLLRSSIPMLLHPDTYGLGFGLYAGLTGLGGNLNILVGWLRDVSGTYDSGLYLLLVLSGLAVLLCIFTNHIEATRHGCLNLSKAELKSWEDIEAMARLKSELTDSFNQQPEEVAPLQHFPSLSPKTQEDVVHCLSQQF